MRDVNLLDVPPALLPEVLMRQGPVRLGAVRGIVVYRACRYCGCDDFNACVAKGPCRWIARDVCSKPSCVAKHAKHRRAR